MLLKSFTDEDGWLYWCNVNEVDHPIRKARPAELFHKNHLYSIISARGEKYPSIEIGLSRHEGDAGHVIRIILDEARAGKVPDFTIEQKRI